LGPDNVRRVCLAPDTQYSVRLLREHVATYPHLAWMVRDSGDYIVGGYWKERPAIGQIMEASPCPLREALAKRLLQSYRTTGSELVVLSEHETGRGLRLYLDMGFASVEHVVCYEKPDVRVPAVERRLAVRPIEEADLPALAELDQATFPWLWWEAEASLRRTVRRPDTWLLAGYLAGALAGYLILTMRGSWGHVNRIGVHPDLQGRGLGRELLAVAIEELGRRGARTIGLNTQSDNLRSQRLYQGFGFAPSGESFDVFGKWLDPAENATPRPSPGD
jgi:ribosomal-protein-alanine N-acetyltransferase